MTDDNLTAGIGFCIIFLILTLFAYLLFWANGKDTQNQRLKTYQNQLNTYILCVQKTTDKSLCGKQPDVQNYL